MGKNKTAKKIAKERMAAKEKKTKKVIRAKTGTLQGYSFGMNMYGTKKGGKELARDIVDAMISKVPDGYRIDGVGVHVLLNPIKNGKLDHIDLSKINKHLAGDPDILSDFIRIAHPPCDVRDLVRFCDKMSGRWMDQDEFNELVSPTMVSTYLRAVNDKHPDNDVCAFLLVNGPGRLVTENDVCDIIHMTGIPFIVQVDDDKNNGSKSYRILSEMDARLHGLI